MIDSHEDILAPLRSLRGLEVVGLACKSFGLPTLNLDFTNDPHTPERLADLQCCGQTRAVDVVALPHRLPFPERSFDYVVCGRLAELPNPAVALREWTRVAARYVLVGYEITNTGELPLVLVELIGEATRVGFEVQALYPFLPWDISGYTLLLVRSSHSAQLWPGLSVKAMHFFARRRPLVGQFLAAIGSAMITDWYVLLLFGVWPLRRLEQDLVRRLRQYQPQQYPYTVPLMASTRQATVGAVVVTYNPGADLLDNLRTILPQVAEVLVIDNASTTGLNQLEAAGALQGVTVHTNRQNLGVATALNQGADWARVRGYQWLATFDQDSRLPGQFVENMLQAVAIYPQSERVAMVFPLAVHPWDPQPLSTSWLGEPRPGQPVRRVDTGITSASLVRVSVLARERWRDEYFVDMVDHEFCLRLGRQGYRMVEAGEVFFFHQTATALSEEVLPSGYAPDRHYYVLRNSLDVYTRYFWTAPWRLTVHLYRVCQIFIWPLLDQPGRNPQKVAAIRQGWRDAWRRIGGIRRN